MIGWLDLASNAASGERTMGNLTRILLGFGLLALALNASARYLPPTLQVLAGASDFIVIGAIVQLDAETFELRADEVLAGEAPPGKLIVQRFEDWACASRWKPYAVGQRVIAFLRRPAEKGPFTLMSAGSEAEWEIQDAIVNSPGYAITGYSQNKPEEYWQRLPLADVRDAFRRYRTCFSVSQSLQRGTAVRRHCEDAALLLYRGRSTLHAFLTQTSLDATAP
jgi:hypothetical protein